MGISLVAWPIVLGNSLGHVFHKPIWRPCSASFRPWPLLPALYTPCFLPGRVMHGSSCERRLTSVRRRRLTVNDNPEGANPNQAVLLARYTENCEQARHHEQLRERTTSMVAQTSGVMLGLLGFKEGTWKDNAIGLFIAVLSCCSVHGGSFPRSCRSLAFGGTGHGSKRFVDASNPGLCRMPRRDRPSGSGSSFIRRSLFLARFCWRSLPAAPS